MATSRGRRWDRLAGPGLARTGSAGMANGTPPLPPQAQSERAVAGVHEGVTCRTSKQRPVIGPKKRCATVDSHFDTMSTFQVFLLAVTPAGLRPGSSSASVFILQEVFLFEPRRLFQVY